MNQPDEAQVRLGRMRSLDATSPQVPFAAAWIASARGKKEEAVSLIESAFQSALKLKAPNTEAIGLAAIDRISAPGATSTPRSAWP